MKKFSKVIQLLKVNLFSSSFFTILFALFMISCESKQNSSLTNSALYAALASATMTPIASNPYYNELYAQQNQQYQTYLEQVKKDRDEQFKQNLLLGAITAGSSLLSMYFLSKNMNSSGGTSNSAQLYSQLYNQMNNQSMSGMYSGLGTNTSSYGLMGYNPSSSVYSGSNSHYNNSSLSGISGLTSNGNAMQGLYNNYQGSQYCPTCYGNTSSLNSTTSQLYGASTLY